MKVIICHPTGNQNVRHAVIALMRYGILHKYHTSLFFFKKSWYYKFLKGPCAIFRRRTYDDRLRGYIKGHPWVESARILSSKLHLSKLTVKSNGLFSVENVYIDVDKGAANEIKKGKADVIYAYDDGALNSFIEAKKKKMICIYDLPTGYYKAKKNMLHDEVQRNPAWSVLLSTFDDSDEKLIRKDNEISLADYIFVASSFTKDTLIHYYQGKLPPIIVIPYGFPQPNLTRTYLPFHNNRKIKALYVGHVNQGKGISYLFDSIKDLYDYVDLTIVGSANRSLCPILDESLKKVNYFSYLPHDKVLELMSSVDIFIFPSLFDGFGMVVTEAMSQGTPVITTDRTCGPEVIETGVDGWVVPAGDSKQINNILKRCIENPNILKEMGIAARKKAMGRPWRYYEDEVVAKIQEVYCEK